MVSLDEFAKSRRGKTLIEEEESTSVTDGRSDLLPTSGFWLEVDGRTKKGWPKFDWAQREASALKQRYPRLRVAVYDAAEKKRVAYD